jgi:hypothetical protein
LAAHGDIPGVRNRLLQKTYNADLIIKELGDLHPQFYPIPGKQKIDPITGRPIEVIRIGSGYLTKDELLRLYGECGNYLHRGSIRQLLTNWEPPLDFKKVATWIEKIIALLNHHQIQTQHPDKQLWVLMQDRTDGKVKWAAMMKLSPDDPRAVATGKVST